jgi:hypothetical protein
MNLLVPTIDGWFQFFGTRMNADKTLDNGGSSR